MIKHQFNEKLQILEVTYLGELSAEEILKFSTYVSTNIELPRKLKILTDATNATYNFNHDTVEKLMSNLKRNLENYQLIMDAFIHSKPKETAFSQLFEIERAYTNYVHKVFATKEAALNWLMMDLY